MNQDRLLIKLTKFIDFARRLADLSTCKRNKVGAIVFPPECTAVWAIGYNGPASGLPNDSCEGGPEQLCSCAHAEANAIAKLATHDSRGILFTTIAPCPGCANLIINCGVIRIVIFDTPYRDPSGCHLLSRANLFTTRFADIGQGYALTRITSIR